MTFIKLEPKKTLKKELIMKKSIYKSSIFLLLCMFLFNISYAQEIFYDLFALEGTEWSIGETSSGSSPYSVDVFHYIRLQGEELINDTLYHKIISIDDFNGSEINIYYYLRMDTDSSLYLRDTYGNEEMIFDYSLLTGESFYVNFWVYRGQIFYDVSEPVNIFIESKSIEDFNGISRTVWNLSFSGNWIQGLGSNSNMLDVFQIPLGYTGYSTNSLCAYFNGTQIYSNPDFNFCDDTGIKTMELKQINISPNPFSSNINISFPELLDTEIKIFDITGNLIFSTYKNQIDLTIDLHGLNPGIYFLKIESKKQTVCRRIVKI